MAKVVDCPSCGRKLRVPDEFLGIKVKCPSCGGAFDADGAPRPPERPSAPAETSASGPPDVPQAPLPPPGEAQVKLSLDDHAAPPAGGPSPEPPAEPRPEAPPRPALPSVRAEELRPCPFCGERIGKRAVRCPYCDEALDEEEERPWERPGRYGVRRDWEPHRGTLILVLGILSIVFGTMCPPVGLPLGIAAWVMGGRDLKKIAGNIMDPDGKGLTQAGWICGIIGTILDSLGTVGCLLYAGFIAFVVYDAQRTQATRRAAPPPPVRKFEAPANPLRFQDYLPARR